MSNVLAWHFLPEGRRLQWNADEYGTITPGMTVKHEGDIGLCVSGLHASRRLIDALQYAPGPIVCRVQMGGRIVEGNDKLVATERTVLWMADAIIALHEFACRCAEDALALVDDPDPRSVAAIQAKRDWLAGKIDDAQLDAAGDAAWAAARDAAGDAAGDAAWAAARDAAWDAQNRRLTAMVSRLEREQ